MKIWVTVLAFAGCLDSECQSYTNAPVKSSQVDKGEYLFSFDLGTGRTTGLTFTPQTATDEINGNHRSFPSYNFGFLYGFADRVSSGVQLHLHQVDFKEGRPNLDEDVFSTFDFVGGFALAKSESSGFVFELALGFTNRRRFDYQAGFAWDFKVIDSVRAAPYLKWSSGDFDDHEGDLKMDAIDIGANIFIPLTQNVNLVLCGSYEFVKWDIGIRPLDHQFKDADWGSAFYFSIGAEYALK